MTTSLTSSAVMPCGRSYGAHRVVGFGMAFGALATLLAGWTPDAIAQQLDDPTPNQVFANCELETSSQGQRINTVAGLQTDILAANPNGANNDKIEDPPVIAYVVVYAIDNDNNGQALVDKDGNLVGFTGPVICVNPDATEGITTALQTDDIPDIDILDIQDALILRHTPTGSDPLADGANRICHTTDGNTDCFDID